MQPKPDFVAELEAIFGGPSESGFGSAVFYDLLPIEAGAIDLKQSAFAKHQLFCGETWTRFGESNWKSGWNEVFLRHTTSSGIVSELRAIRESTVKSIVPILLDEIENKEAAHAALAKAFDATTVEHLVVFSMGDNNAMSGILIAADRGSEGRIYLAFLMD